MFAGGPSPRLNTKKDGQDALPTESAQTRQGNPDQRGGAGSRGTRQLGPNDRGLGRVDGRIRSFRKERGWTPAGGNGQRTVCRNSLSHRSAGNVGAWIGDHRRRETLTAIASREA